MVTVAQVAGIVLVLIAAAVEALSNVLQHKATNSVGTQGGELGALGRTLKQPLFILGFVLMIVGYGFHIASLGLGILAVIQVIFVTQLVFILPFSKWISKVEIPRSDWIGAIVVTAGIAVFVSFAQPSEGTKEVSDTKWLWAIGVTMAICVVLIVIGYRFTGGPRAALLGCSGGVVNGLVAAVTTGAIAVAGKGIGGLLTDWLIWVTLITAMLGVLFPLLAFRAGPITASFPAVMSLNPIVATILGVYLFQQDLEGGLVSYLMMIASGIVIFVGIIWLSRSKAISAAFQDSDGSQTATVL